LIPTLGRLLTSQHQHDLNDMVFYCIILRKRRNVWVYYCEITLCQGQKNSWIDFNGHVCGHLHVWILNYF